MTDNDCVTSSDRKQKTRDLSVRVRSFLKEFVLYLMISLSAICALTVLGNVAASHLSPDTEELIQEWIQQSPANRFDDWMDGVVLANILYKSIEPQTSLWTYILPSKAPIGGWDLLRYVLSRKNRAELYANLRHRRGDVLHRYWTGHIALTALAMYVYTNPTVASKAALSCVLFGMILYVLAWRKRLGLSGAVCMAVLCLGSGVVYLESFHTHTWGLAFAFATAAYTARRLDAGKSCVAPAVVGAVFANWVGYDYVFPSIAFSLPFFAVRQNGTLTIEDFGAPVKFSLVFLAVTALMMVSRIPVAYFAENCPPSTFLSQLFEQIAYRVEGKFRPWEIDTGGGISRKTAILSALPSINTYLFHLGGRYAPLVYSVGNYIAYQALPIAALAGITVLRNRREQIRALKPALLVTASVIMFHLLLIVLVNHACVHPWMHARFMVLALTVSWSALFSALSPGDLVGRLSTRFSNTE